MLIFLSILIYLLTNFCWIILVCNSMSVVQKQYVKEVYKRCISASRLVMDFADDRSVIDPKFLNEPHFFHNIQKIEESKWDHAGLYDDILYVRIS